MSGYYGPQGWVPGYETHPRQYGKVAELAADIRRNLPCTCDPRALDCCDGDACLACAAFPARFGCVQEALA